MCVCMYLSVCVCADLNLSNTLVYLSAIAQMHRNYIIILFVVFLYIGWLFKMYIIILLLLLSFPFFLSFLFHSASIFIISISIAFCIFVCFIFIFYFFVFVCLFVIFFVFDASGVMRAARSKWKGYIWIELAMSMSSDKIIQIGEEHMVYANTLSGCFWLHNIANTRMCERFNSSQFDESGSSTISLAP